MAALIAGARDCQLFLFLADIFVFDGRLQQFSQESQPLASLRPATAQLRLASLIELAKRGKQAIE